MRPLLLRQVVEELPNTGILRPASRLFIKAAALYLQNDHLIADRIEPQGPYQPDRLALASSMQPDVQTRRARA